ncbi:MAG TPA: Por secretion system protein, partial [Bacteroidales bacterium]|nr:Por secretion system protein [Bacteroidales bacterium]
MKKLKAIVAACGLATIFYSVTGQVVTTVPVYPIDTDSATVYFDATQGSAGLKDVSPPIYAHTGVITNLSISGSDWKYVLADWGVNTDKARLTPLGNNRYSLKLKPSIRAFYGVPASEQILKLAFVFRNSDGSKTGKNADGSDIFSDVYPDQLSVNVSLPADKALFLKQLDAIPISAISPPATSMKLFVNGTLVKSVSGNTLTDTIGADNFGQNWVKRWVRIVASNNDSSVADSFSYTVIPNAPVAELPAGVVDGINYLDATTALLCLYAPGKDHAFATGDFNDWQLDSASYMFLTPDHSRFWLNIGGLTAKQEYIFQYVVDGTIRIGDPYADKVSDPNDTYIAPATYPNLKPYP